MTSSRNAIIRNIATIAGGTAVGTAVASACTWVIASASLSMFMAFCVWLIGAIVMYVGTTLTVGAIGILLTDARIDDSIALTKGFFSRFVPAKVAA